MRSCGSRRLPETLRGMLRGVDFLDFFERVLIAVKTFRSSDIPRFRQRSSRISDAGFRRAITAPKAVSTTAQPQSGTNAIQALPVASHSTPLMVGMTIAHV